MDEREIMKAREGAKAARQRFGAVPGRNQADLPLDVVQIDHTRADIILVDRFERKPIGRPWVTLAIDIATRMVTGYYVSFEAPSRLSVALCLTRAVAPKAELLAQLDSNVPWPAHQLPSNEPDRHLAFKGKEWRLLTPNAANLGIKDKVTRMARCRRT